VLHFVIALLASQTPTPTPAVAAPQVLVLDLQAVAVPPEKAQLLTARIAQSLARNGLDVVTSADLRQLVSLEAERSVNGCDTSSASCIAELANALGTRLVVSGQIGELDKDHLVLQLSLFDSSQGRAVSREEAAGASIAAVADAIPATLTRLMAPIGLPASTTTTAAPPPTTTKEGSLLVPIGGGVGGLGVLVLAAAGAGAWFLNDALERPDAAQADKQAAVDNGTLALAGLGVGAALTAAGAGVLIAGMVQE